jgi:drug/metabolite transporter (DMT)-like permease
MSTLGVWLIILSGVCTAVANLMMRRGVLNIGHFQLSAAAMKTQVIALAQQPLFVIGFLLYGVAALIWFRILASEPLSSSYPMLVSLTFLLVTVGAMLVFGEKVNALKIAGLVVILGGILLVSRA